MKATSDRIASARERHSLAWSRKTAGSRWRVVFVQVGFFMLAVCSLAFVDLLRRIAGMEGALREAIGSMEWWLLVLFWVHIGVAQVLLPSLLLWALHRHVRMIDEIKH